MLAELLGAVALAAPLPAPAGADGPPVSAAAAPPPALSALLRKMQALHPRSTAATTTFDWRITRGPLRGQMHVEETGVSTVAPSAASVRVSLSFRGRRGVFRLRTVAERTYEYEYARGALDAGRPWVEFEPDREPYSEEFPSLRSPWILEDPPRMYPYEGTARSLARARNVRELGPAVIDGQPTTGFAASVEGRPMTVYIAASGLPVLTRARGRDEQSTLDLTVEIHAVDFPLTIGPPPPGHTIRRHELERIEKARRGR